MGSQVLAKTVADILRDATIQKVRFVLSGLWVFGFRYERVLDAVQKGNISCEVGVPPNQHLPAGYAAKCRYDPDTHRLLFPRENYGLSPGTETFDIVHEATHASFDYFYGRRGGFYVSAIEDEAAAFLAQAIYSRISPKLWSGVIFPGDPIEEALKVADKIMAIPGVFREDRPPYHVPPADLMALRGSIQTAYQFVGGAAGIQHVYNGVPR